MVPLLAVVLSLIDMIRRTELSLTADHPTLLLHYAALGGVLTHCVLQHGQASSPPWQCPSSAPTPPQGPGNSDGLGAFRGEAGLLGVWPLSRVLERAASKAADSPGYD